MALGAGALAGAWAAKNIWAILTAIVAAQQGASLYSQHKAGKREEKTLDLQEFMQRLSRTAEKEGKSRNIRDKTQAIQENLLQLRKNALADEERNFQQEMIKAQGAIEQQNIANLGQIAGQMAQQPSAAGALQQAGVDPLMSLLR